MDEEKLQDKPEVPESFDPPESWGDLMQQEAEDEITEYWISRPCPRCDEPGGLGYCPNCHNGWRWQPKEGE